MVKIKIDDKEVEVKEGTTLLEAAKSVKAEIPHFCYHSKLSISGNCRMCLVQIEGQAKPVISCRERAREGMVVHTKTPEVKKMQQSVLEFILLNHPLDCPICDQSGECDLQDHYFKYSNFPSRLEEEKIHKPKVKQLGPLVTLDDERCIVCTRCVRFCDEIAGVYELCVIDRGGHSTLTTYPGKELKNPYSLCTVDVCPVGALTSTDFRFQKRVWFLKSFRSVCTGCSTGCNIRVDQDDGVVYRYKPRDNEAVNQCWMCDEGRLSYKFINDERGCNPSQRVCDPLHRVFDPLHKKEGILFKTDWEEALQEVRSFSPSPLEGEGARRTGEGEPSFPVVFVLSAQATCEENFALYQYAKQFKNVHFMVTGKEVQNPSQDGFLISADKNPNWAFLHLLEKSVTLPLTPSHQGRGVVPPRREWGEGEIPQGAVIYVLEGVSTKLRQKIVDSKPKKVIGLVSNLYDDTNWADLLFPKPTFVEQDGTFVNRQNRIQRIWKGFEPKGHAKPVWEILRLLNPKFPFASAEAIFQEMTEEISVLKGLTYREIGDQGIPLPFVRGG